MVDYPPHGLPDWDDELKAYIDWMASGAAATDEQVAGFVEDDDSDTQAAILALIGEIAPALPVFPIDNYSPNADGVTNDDAAFAAAKAAATAEGGGVILLGPHRYRINSVFTPGEGNSLRAPMNALAASMDKYCIVLGSGTAQVQLAGDAQGRGGNHGNFNVDANGTGETDGAVRLIVNDQIVAPITVSDAPGVGYLIYACQNSKILQPVVDGCQDNVVIDGGSGGLTIENMHSTSPTRYGLLVHDSDPGGHAFGYQYGPSDILFVKPLVEQYTGTCTSLVQINSGSRLKFEQPGLSVNAQSVSGNAIVCITNDDFAALGTVGTEVEFSSGNYHGGVTALEKIFYVKGTNTFTGNKLVVNGQSFFQQSAALFSTDGATIAALDEEQWYVAPTVSAIFDAGNPASSMFFWRKVQRTGMVFSLPDAAGAFSGHTPLQFRKSTDSTAGSRLYIANDGTMGWPNGTNNVALVTATPDTTNKFIDFSGLKMSGKKVTGLSLTTVSSAGTSLALDVSTIAPVHIVSLSSVGTITAWTLTNPVDGQEIELWITRAGAQTFVWPSNITWEAGIAPPREPTAGQYMRVFLKYTSSGSMWWEHGQRMHTTKTKPTEVFMIAASDETTAITTGTAKVTFRMPFAMTLTGVKASLTTASSSGIPTVDINEGGSTILSTKLTIDASEKTSTTAATAAVISDSALADDAEMTIDVDVAGTGATGLKVYLIGYRV